MAAREKFLKHLALYVIFENYLDFFSMMKEEFEFSWDFQSRLENLKGERNSFFIKFLLGNSWEEALFQTSYNSEENDTVAEANGE